MVIMLENLLNIIYIVAGFNYPFYSANIYLFQNTCGEIVSNIHLPNRHWQVTHKMVCEYLKWTSQCWMDFKSSWTSNSFHQASISIMQIELIPTLPYSISDDAINFSIQSVNDAVYGSITPGSSFGSSVRYMVCQFHMVCRSRVIHLVYIGSSSVSFCIIFPKYASGTNCLNFNFQQ